MNKKILVYFFLVSMLLSLLPLSAPHVGATTYRLGNDGRGTYNEQGYDAVTWAWLFNNEYTGGAGSTYTTDYKTATGYLTDHTTEYGSIDSVNVTLLMYGNGIIGGDAQQKIYTHNTLYAGNTFSVDTTTRFTNTYSWTTNPNTGIAWTWQEVDDLEAGLSMKLDSITIGLLIICYEMWVNVSYTPGKIATTNNATDRTSVTATLNGVAYADGNPSMTCGFQYNYTGGTRTNITCAGTYNNGVAFSQAISSLIANKKYYCRAWAYSVSSGYANGSDDMAFYTDDKAPNVTINFSGNISDMGGPYYRPPGESDILDEAGEGIFRGGYYTNDSYQHEDWMYINLTVKDNTGGLGVSDVVLHWLTYPNTWDNTTSFTRNHRFTWTINKTGVATGKYSFDIYAVDNASNSNIIWWNKTVLASGITRRYVNLANTPVSISYTPYYFYEANYSFAVDATKKDRIHHDQGVDGGTLGIDSGYMLSTLPTGVTTYRNCLAFIGLFFDDNTCILPIEIKNAYYHVWESSSTPAGIYNFLYRTRGNPLSYPGVSKIFSSFDDVSTTPKSSIVYSGNTYYLNSRYNRRTTVVDSNFTDNSIYELVYGVDDANIKVISNRSYTSFILLNVPDNTTIDVSYNDSDGDGLHDWFELYRSFTNPFLSDTDNDGAIDIWERNFSYDPNNYTSGHLSTYYYIGPPTGVSSTVYGGGTIDINITWTMGLNATKTVVQRSSTTQPILPTDGTTVYNGTHLDFNDTGLSIPYYYTLFSWNETTNTYSTGVNVSWFVIWVNVYNETNGLNITDYTLFFSNTQGDDTYSATLCNNPYILSSTTAPTGTDITLIVSAPGYQQRSYLFETLNPTDNYYINAYLPPVEVDTGEPTPDCTLRSLTDSISISNMGVNAVITTTHTIDEIISVEVYNDSLYGSYGGWITVPSGQYSSNSTNVTIKHTALHDGISCCNTTMARCTYYYWDCPNETATTPLYRLRIIETISTDYNDIDRGVEGVIVRILRSINDTGSFVEVSSIRSDSNGYVNVFLIPETFYKVSVNDSLFMPMISNYITDPPNEYGQTLQRDFRLIRKNATYDFSDIIDIETIFTNITRINEVNLTYTLRFCFTDISMLTTWVNYTISMYNYSSLTWINYPSVNISSYEFCGFKYNTNISNYYQVNISYYHQGLGLKQRILILERGYPGYTNETELNLRFSWLGVVVGGATNFIMFIIFIGMMFNIDSRDTGKGIMLIGFIFLVVQVFIIKDLLILVGSGIMPVLFIVMGVLMEWNHRKVK